MKKILLSTLALSLCLGSFAQNRFAGKSIATIKPAPKDKIVPTVMMMPVSGDEAPLQKSFLPVARHASKTSATQQTIGNTTYDLQSNGSSIAARVYNTGNELGAAWTFSTDLLGAYPDRGTGVNRSTDNGVTWGTFPTSRIESKRSGFGSFDRIGSGEVVVGHAAGAPLTLYSHATLAAPWDSSLIPFLTVGYPLWNSMKVGGNNGTTIHMVTATAPLAQTPSGSLFYGMDGAMAYYRSLNGGLTWDISGIQLPESDTSSASPYLNFRANSYAIDAKGDNVAVVSGSIATDWSLWKSSDNGTTWTRTAILAFPIPKFDQLTMDTDFDGDGVADTVICSDGAVSVVIDNNGIAHCFSGSMIVFEAPGNGAINLDLSANGLMYWNENMGANPPVVIAASPDLDGDGLVLSFAANFTTCRYGNDGLCSMPTAGVDAFNNIYVAYTNLMELTDDGSLGCSYRNTWAVASADGGTTWLPPLNVSNSMFDEAVYPSVARDVDNPGCLHLIWQQDGIPGTSVPPNGVHPIGVNDMIYSCVDPNVDLGVPTGINENMASQNVISVSPNPASDFIKFTFTLKKLSSIEMDIYNVNGQKVDHISQENASGTLCIIVKTDQYSSGIYSVTSKVGDTSYTNKFVVN